MYAIEKYFDTYYERNIAIVETIEEAKKIKNEYQKNHFIGPYTTIEIRDIGEKHGK